MEESGYIAIVDYGLGNVGSVRNALTRLGAQVVVTNEQSQLRQANGLILPGVGAFGDGMQKLRDLKLDKILSLLVLEERKPILGICLGMQLMASMGLEHGEHPGLGWFDATVERLPVEQFGLKIPHVGWNNVIAVRDGTIFDTSEVDACFYFVHGYHVELASSQDLVGTCDYGIPFAAIIQKDNIMGTQFHPEKSQKAGLALLGRFMVTAKQSAMSHA
ncbi:MAG: imidazole glycerol phosphate synthase subunit HisH [Candidatus Obscuribacter sp.]|nr:imidazole glycerol phosphate synthase subunit HisH [Candidatus Obscuribacter sp.]